MPLDRKFIEVKCYETYYFSNIVKNILDDQLVYLRNLNDFYGDNNIFFFTESFPRHSAFHTFIGFVVENLLFEDLSNIDLDEARQNIEKFSSVMASHNDYTMLPVNHALQYYGIQHPTFIEWLKEKGRTFNEADVDDVHEYFIELNMTGPLHELLDRTVGEVFYILFANRGVLHDFNVMMANVLLDTTMDEVPAEFQNNFAKDGMLKRTAIPQWVKKAIFYRDRGLCVFCRKDISGLISINNEKNFDHIVPLASGGLNDVTNLQLLCVECNNKKRDGASLTSDNYEAWY